MRHNQYFWLTLEHAQERKLELIAFVEIGSTVSLLNSNRVPRINFHENRKKVRSNKHNTRNIY